MQGRFMFQEGIWQSFYGRWLISPDTVLKLAQPLLGIQKIAANFQFFWRDGN